MLPHWSTTLIWQVSPSTRPAIACEAWLFDVGSQEKAAAAQQAGYFAGEIIPVSILQRRGDPVIFDTDEHPRAGSTFEKLAKLGTPFRENGTVTAGNASGVNDGACALIIASKEAAERNGLTPHTRIIAMATAGLAPRIMGFGPAPATRKVLKLAGLSLDNMEIGRASL